MKYKYDDKIENLMVEVFANFCHNQWANWMEWMLPRVLDNPKHINSDYPETWTERWRRQMRTPYSELSEDEKESDRKEARKILSILKETMEAKA